jgi:CSLREA domain-containing protein
MSYKIFNKLTFLMAFSVFALGAAQTAAAATRTVTKAADTNDNICNVDCSLREAVAVAVAGDTIVFVPGLGGQTITLTNGLIKINKNLVIKGVDGLTISGNNASRIFYITDGVSVSIDNLDLKNGFATYPDVMDNGFGSGGAILADEKSTLSLQNVVLSFNNAMSGGAIEITGTLKLKNTTISNNKAIHGGGILASGEYGTLVEIMDSVIKSNQASYGGGLRMSNGTLLMTGTTVSGNTATTDGGGGGGIYLTGSNYGLGTSYGTNYMITYSTVSGNTALEGGGIYNLGNLLFINSTLSGNKATKTHGGGIYHFTNGGLRVGKVTLRNATVTLNTASLGTGGGIHREGDFSEFNVANSIIAGNSNLNNTAPDVKGVVNSLGYNLFGSTMGINVLGDWSGVKFNANPGLAPLANNGGKTRTHLPYYTSPAINAGSDSLATDENGFMLSTDQRGKVRFNGAVDLGAVEYYNQRIVFPYPSGREQGRQDQSPSDF